MRRHEDVSPLLFCPPDGERPAAETFRDPAASVRERSEVDHVPGQAVHRFLHGLAQRRVGVHVAGDLVHREVPLLGQGQLGQQLGDLGPIRWPPMSSPYLASAISFTKPTGSARPWALPLAVNGNLDTLTS